MYVDETEVTISKVNQEAQAFSNDDESNAAMVSHRTPSPGYHGTPLRAPSSSIEMDGLATPVLPIVSPRTEALLLRCFIQEIAPRFDMCDSEKHFSRLVPSRARTSATLMNAICTIAARHLNHTRLSTPRNGPFSWNGEVIDDLTSETATLFQNKCIRELLWASVQPDRVHNEDLLVASIILRSDEEINTPVADNERDNGIFLQVTNAFIDAQPLQSPYIPDSWLEQTALPEANTVSPRSMHDQPTYVTHRQSNPSPSTSGVRLRQVCFWVALRQELHAALMLQRHFNFPLSRCGPLRELSPADDTIWANRLVIFCADVVEYCYAGQSDLLVQQKTSKWDTLKQQGDSLRASLPQSFEPIYYQSPDPMSEELFPTVWYQDASHAIGATYEALAQILLDNFNPKQPLLGPGKRSSITQISQRSRTTTALLCGIALGNRSVPPLLLNACSAIVLCGELFTKRCEQDCLVDFLMLVEHEVAYPTSGVLSDLRRGWACRESVLID